MRLQLILNRRNIHILANKSHGKSHGFLPKKIKKLRNEFNNISFSPIWCLKTVLGFGTIYPMTVWATFTGLFFDVWWVTESAILLVFENYECWPRALRCVLLNFSPWENKTILVSKKHLTVIYFRRTKRCLILTIVSFYCIVVSLHVFEKVLFKA